MSAQSLIEVDGNKYMSTKTAAELWGLSSRTVSDYCKKNRIHRRFKNGKLGWYIHIDEIKPLSDTEIHRLLVLSIQLKNDPSLTIDWTTFNFDDEAIDAIYQSLCLSGYIHSYSVSDKRRIPYEVILTQKGLEMATAFNKKSIPDFSTVCSQWLPVLINIAQLYIRIKQSA
ncbi:MAG: helix-turn-helix domain-containing protein [Clostridia bacterium]|nr:helix-turn-helix domain-containing protein [Clostridia bacterium]